MRIYNGNLLDVSDYASDSFLAINSCGYQKHERGCTVIRPIGRRGHYASELPQRHLHGACV